MAEETSESLWLKIPAEMRDEWLLSGCGKGDAVTSEGGGKMEGRRTRRTRRTTTRGRGKEQEEEEDGERGGGGEKRRRGVNKEQEEKEETLARKLGHHHAGIKAWAKPWRSLWMLAKKEVLSTRTSPRSVQTASSICRSLSAELAWSCMPSPLWKSPTFDAYAILLPSLTLPLPLCPSLPSLSLSPSPSLPLSL
jgi:hypothetical protein